MTNVLISCAIAIAVLMISVWLESVRRADASIVDLVWGFGFAVVAWTAYFISDQPQPARLLLPVLTSIWGLRLSVYLTWRNHGRPEDYRYREMRKKWGDSFPLASLLTVFALQGAVMWVVSIPVQIGTTKVVDGFSWGTLIGILVWAVGLFFESVGDWQLSRFKADPANQGRVLDNGLWRYTRHPNYFGDFLVWWGLFFVAVAQSGVWWTVIGPIVMSFFLMRVSGVTLLEKTLRKTKPQYDDYIQRTNAFFPGRPSKT